MPKPKFQYTCPCGFRTNKSWRLRDHKHKAKPKVQAVADPLKGLFPRG